MQVATVSRDFEPALLAEWDAMDLKLAAAECAPGVAVMALQLLTALEARGAADAVQRAWNVSVELQAALASERGEHGWFIETPQSSLFPLLLGEVRIPCPAALRVFIHDTGPCAEHRCCLPAAKPAVMNPPSP